MVPYIIDLRTNTIIDPAKIFGGDANQLLAACSKAFHNWLPSHQYEGCYRSASRPTLKKFRNTFSDVNSAIAAYKAATTAWKAAHPEEVIKEQLSCKKWENARDKQFRIIYGISSRHKVYLKHSTSCGDIWTIYMCGEPIARIHCM